MPAPVSPHRLHVRLHGRDLFAATVRPQTDADRHRIHGPLAEAADPRRGTIRLFLASAALFCAATMAVVGAGL